MDLFEQRILQLRDELNRHNHAYYVLNSPLISDREYDELMRELQDLEAAYPQYADELSPTQRVGSDLTKGFTQVTHERPMMSLSNSYSVEEVQDFLRRAGQGLGIAPGTPLEIVGEMKYDGTSISLLYEHGRLVRAVTRGDGTRGDDVTDNVKTIRSIPLQLQPGSWPERFEVRGEILLPWESFERLNKERAFNEEPLFANPRNAAAGTLKLQNSAEVSRRGLDARIYFLLADALPADTHARCMELMRQWGFKTGDVTVLPDVEAVKDFIEYWDRERKNLPVATDGLVFKLNDTAQWTALGATAKSPRWAIAFKFAPEREATRLVDVSFEVGRTGVITPVANLEPVQLSGTIVKRASLHNEDIIRSLDIHDGDMVYVEKGGEIIPKIVGVDKSRRVDGSRPIEFVSRCPQCGTPLRRVEGEAAWICPNSRECPPQVVGRIEHFVSRHAMNIEGVGSEVAVALNRYMDVATPADLYTLSAVDLIRKMPSFRERSAERLLKGLDDSKKVPFERVLFAISINGVGETTAKTVALHVKNVDTLMAMTAIELAAIPDVGEKTAQSIVDFFTDEDNRRMVQRLREAGLQFALSEDRLSGMTDRLAGKKIVISGTFARHSRDEYKQLIEQNGGKNVSSISKATSMILAGENMGPAKHEKAQKLGIAIINEEQFLEMIAAD